MMAITSRAGFAPASCLGKTTQSVKLPSSRRWPMWFKIRCGTRDSSTSRSSRAISIWLANKTTNSKGSVGCSGDVMQPLRSQNGRGLSLKLPASQLKAANLRATKSKINIRKKSTSSKITMDKSMSDTWAWSTNTKSGSSGRKSQICSKLIKMRRKWWLSL